MASARPTEPLGRYRLEHLIARGGMGEVFRAVALGAGGFRKPVVIKRVLPKLGGKRGLVDMFAEEARLMSRLVHPNIVQVLDFGRGRDDDYFLVMELVDGVDLHRFCKSWWQREQDVPIATALLVCRQVLRGLHHAHTKAHGDGRALVHRDVSPGNILLSTVGEVKVADFGVALVARPGEETGGEHIVGKPAYMAPEQYRGDPVDARADVFSVGVVLYRMLCGEVPFEGADAAARQREAAAGRWRPLDGVRGDLGEHLPAIVAQALAPEPADRFVSARAMGGALDALRSCGYGSASADELAEQVERATQASEPSLQPVIDLGDGGAPAAGRGAVVRELSRLGPGGRFTMQLTELGPSETLSTIRTPSSHPSVARHLATSDDGRRREGSAAEQEPPPRSSRAGEPTVVVPLSSRRGPVMLAASLAVVLLALGWWLTGAPAGEPTASDVPWGAASPAASASAAAPGPSQISPPPSTGAPTQTVSAAAAPSGRAGPPEAPDRVVTPPAVAGSARAITGARPSASPSAVDSAAAACRGRVLLAAKGSWWVTGGPVRVQAPGQYRWRCGSYQLTATSRVDGRTVSRTVQVSEGGQGVVRFE